MKTHELIKAKRLALDLTLDELGDAAGVSKSHLHGLENGKHPNFSFITAIRLSVALGIPLQVLAASMISNNEEIKS